MGLTPRRLLDYFSVEELKFVLSTINESQSGTREELIERVLSEWPAHNKKWQHLLQFLDKPTLSQICKDYSLGHVGSRDLLEKRIRWELRSQTKNQDKKNSKQQLHTQDIHSHQFLFHPQSRRDWSKIGVVVGIIATAVTIIGIILSQNQIVLK